MHRSCSGPPRSPPCGWRETAAGGHGGWSTGGGGAATWLPSIAPPDLGGVVYQQATSGPVNVVINVSAVDGGYMDRWLAGNGQRIAERVAREVGRRGVTR